jgi:hypothetical protein
MITVGLTAVILSAGAAVDRVAAQDGVELENSTLQDGPDERILSVNEDVFVESYEYENGDVVITLASRVDNARVRVEDGMSEWDADADGYEQTFTLNKGGTRITVPNAGTFENEYFGILIYEVRGNGKAAVADKVTKVVDPPMPSAGATFWLVFAGMFMFSTLGAYLILRWRGGIARIRKLTVKKW